MKQPWAYFNEIDREKAAWIRELIKVGVVAPGEVDERSILNVRADDLRGFTQCHFFAGIGVWSYALRLAGWDDSRPVWTGSCPCPSFSCAGKGEGFDDPRHLWPDWVRLIRECKPPVIFGEQSDDAIGFGWLDLVQTDLEAENYAVGKAVLASASVGGSDIRERLYWLADSGSQRRQQERCGSSRNEEANGREGRDAFQLHSHHLFAGSGATERLADTSSMRAERLSKEGRLHLFDADGSSEVSGMAHAERDRWGARRTSESRREGGRALVDHGSRENRNPFSDALKGFWRDADWLLCTDGKWRPVEPGTFPLVNGAPARLGRLRGYGDAINAEVAKAFIESYMEIQ